jgi:hypothetical protein
LSILKVFICALFFQLGEIIPHRVYYSENEKNLEYSSVCLVIFDIDGIDVDNQDSHVPKMEEATDHVDIISKFSPFKINDILNSLRLK